MASEDTENSAAGSLLSGLMAPLRLPERALDALDALAGAAGVLDDIRSELAAVGRRTGALAELVPLTKEIKNQIDPMATTVERIRGQAEPLEELLPALEALKQAVEQRLGAAHETMMALETHEARLNDRVDELGEEIVALHRTVSGLKEDVERVTDRLPDSSRGPLEKARDALTGSGDQRGGGET